MSDTFDPYYKWLGIPPAHQPADHYRLLGIEPFEGDADVISLAADQRMTFLRTFQSGEQSELSQRLLNEVAAAKICLLNAKEKARYDAELARKTPPDAPPPLPAGDDSQGAFAAFAVGSQTDSASSRSRGSTQDKAGLQKKKTRVPVVGIAVVILLVIVLVGLILWGTEKKQRQRIGRTTTAQRKETPTPTFPGPRKKTPTKPSQPAAKPAAASATVTKTTVTKTTPPPPAAPNAPQGPAEPSEEESARTRLKEKYNLEEDAWAHTWKLVNEQTRKLEALETSGSSGVAGGAEFEAELKRRIEEKKQEIMDRWIWVRQQPGGNPQLDAEYYHLMTIVAYPDNAETSYVRDGIPEITSIRAQVEREFASRGPATVDPATVGLTEAIGKRYVTLAADPEVTKLLEQAGGKLAGPPGDAAGANLSLADAQTVGRGTPNETDQAQGAGKNNAGSDPNAQTPGGANRANPGGPAAPQPPAQQVATNKPAAPQAEEPATPRTDDEFKSNFEFMEKNDSWRHADEGDLKGFMKDARKTAKEFGISVKNRVKALNKLKDSQSDIENLKGRIATGTARQNTEGLKKPEKTQIDQKLLFLKNQLKAANGSLEKYKNNVDNPEVNPDIGKTEEALKQAENLQKKIAQLSEKYQGYSGEEFEGVENITITTQANSYAKSLETLRNNFNKQKQNLEAAK